MVAAQRHDAILRELELRGSISITAYSDRTGVSQVTLRRDLTHLESLGLLVRVHGGAVSRAVHVQQTAGRAGARPLATVGMIVPSSAYYFPDIIRGASDAARGLQCRLVLGTTNYSDQEELVQVERLLRIGVDALMVTPRRALQSTAPLYDALAGSSVPVVLVEREVDDRGASRIDSVHSDHAVGAELAVRHLHERGHRRIALATRDSSTAIGLIRGYERAMSELGLRGHDLHRSVRGPQLPGMPRESSLAFFLDLCVERGVTGVIVLGDDLAMELESLILERGIRLPQDLALVSYDNEFSALAPIPLTAVSPPKHDLGAAAMRLCVDRIRLSENAEPTVTRIAMLPFLIERESTQTVRE